MKVVIIGGVAAGATTAARTEKIKQRCGDYYV